MDSPFKEAAHEFTDLIVNAGLIDSISDSWPERVQENWVERLENMKNWASAQIREVQEFASAFDED